MLTLEVTFTPSNPLIGMKSTSPSPVCFKKGFKEVTISSNLSFFHPTVSILVITHKTFWTPKVLASYACSVVWPPFSNPDSNSPIFEETISKATSA